MSTRDVVEFHGFIHASTVYRPLARSGAEGALALLAPRGFSKKDRRAIVAAMQSAPLEPGARSVFEIAVNTIDQMPLGTLRRVPARRLLRAELRDFLGGLPKQLRAHYSAELERSPQQTAMRLESLRRDQPAPGNNALFLNDLVANSDVAAVRSFFRPAMLTSRSYGVWLLREALRHHKDDTALFLVDQGVSPSDEVNVNDGGALVTLARRGDDNGDMAMKLARAGALSAGQDSMRAIERAVSATCIESSCPRMLDAILTYVCEARPNEAMAIVNLAMHECALARNPHCLAVALAHGANPNDINEENATLRASALVTVVGPQLGNRPREQYVQDVERCVTLLLDAKADANCGAFMNGSKLSPQESPLMNALRYFDVGETTIHRTLVDAGANPEYTHTFWSRETIVTFAKRGEREYGFKGNVDFARTLMTSAEP